MKKILFSVITLLSLVPSAVLRAEEQVVLPAMDPRVLKLFGQTKEQIAEEQVKLLQKNRDQLARIKELENTIEQRSYKLGFTNGSMIFGSIGAVATALTWLASRSAGSRRY